jgi:hypothetical protein
LGIDADPEMLTSFGELDVETTTDASLPLPTCTIFVLVLDPAVPRPTKNVATNNAAVIASASAIRGIVGFSANLIRASDRG